MYINTREFLYQLILCKGRGKINREVEKMLILIIDNIAHKFKYNSDSDKNDCKQHAIMNLLMHWKCFDEVKYDNPLSYFTEMGKRSMVEGHNKLKGIKYYDKGKYRTFSMDSYFMKQNNNYK